MASDSSGVRMGRAFVELGVYDQFSKHLKDAEEKFKKLGKSIAAGGAVLSGIGAAITAPLALAFNQFVGMGDALADMSKRTGVAVESFSRLGFAASQSGSDLATVETGIRMMQRTIGGVGDESQTAEKKLAALGLTFANLRGLTPEKQFMLIADRVAQIGDPTARTAAALGVMGRSATQLIPLMLEGADGIAALGDEAQRSGLVMSGESAAAADRLSDMMSKLSQQIKMVAVEIGSALAPEMKKYLGIASEVGAKVIAWIKEHKALVVTISKIGLAFTAAGGVLLATGGAFTVLGYAIGVLKVPMMILSTGIGAVTALMSAMISPVGLIVAAVATIGFAFVTASGNAVNAITWLAEKFGELKAWTSDVFGAIANALAAGEIGLAAEVLWASLKVIWNTGVNALNQIWQPVRTFFVKVVGEMWFGAQALFEEGAYAMQTAWVATTDFLAQTWERFTSFMADTWNTIANLIQKAWNWLKGLFDSTFDAEAANIAADIALVEKLGKNQEESKAKLAALETAKNAKMNAQAEAHRRQMEEIGAASLAFEKDATDENAKRLQASKDALTASEAALASAKQRANEAAPLESGKGPSKFRGIEDDLLGGIAAAKASVVGTFSAGAAGLLASGASGDTRRIAKAVEELVPLTREIRNSSKRPPQWGP